MTPDRVIRFALILNIMLTVIPLTACTNKQPEPVVTGEETTPLGNINVITELEEIVESEDGSNVPEALLFHVEVENAESMGTNLMGVAFVYETVVPTGEKTYMLEYPTDEESGYISDENGPILYEVVEQRPDRLEDWGPIAENVRQFYVILPENAFSIKYHVEVIVPTGEQEVILYDSPMVTVGDIMEQGGLIQEIGE